MKQIVVLAIAIFVGVLVYRKLNGRRMSGTAGRTDGLYEGPDVDPSTGAYLGPGAQPGTVEFSAQGN